MGKRGTVHLQNTRKSNLRIFTERREKYILLQLEIAVFTCMYKHHYRITLLHPGYQIYILSFPVFIFLLNTMWFNFPSPMNFYGPQNLDWSYSLTSFPPKAPVGSCSVMLLQHVRPLVARLSSQKSSSVLAADSRYSDATDYCVFHWKRNKDLEMTYSVIYMLGKKQTKQNKNQTPKHKKPQQNKNNKTKTNQMKEL